MTLSRAGDNRGLLRLVSDVLGLAGPGFPDTAVTEYLRDIFQADFAGAGEIDFRGTASRPWADSPAPIPVGPGEFHRYAVNHPLARAHQRIGRPVPLRLSDVVSPRSAPPSYDGSGMSHVLTIPLEITSHRQCAIALLRSGRDFTATELELARQLQPVLGGIHALCGRLIPYPAGVPVLDGLNDPITARELAVFALLADGLVAAAIGRRLGISPRTVSKHVQNIYRKLGTHDRISAVLRGQALGILGPGRPARPG